MNERDFCRWDDADLLLEVRVVPNARQSRIAGLRHGRLLVRLHAPPVDGKANAELEAVIANACGVHRRAVHIERGETGRDKTVRIERPGTMPAFD